MSPNEPPHEPPTTLPPAGDAFLAHLRASFDKVVELPDSARAEWIAANIDDPEMRAALQRLLSSDAATGGFFDTPASERVAGIEAESPAEAAAAERLVGTRIGAFRLVRLLGKGGMSIVFRAERDGDFQQRVAIKLLRRGLYSELEQRLFQRERQLLANLSHANIAHVIDGGVTDAGIPYIAMEYVDGETLSEHVARVSPDLRTRLLLFLVVCRAVEAAHRSLVVHRDIKPSNILVATDGTVKLLDFGIAKLVEDDDEVPTAAVFTPEYAAPEQRAGRPVTTATDVYALGIVLHELLLGQRPQGSPARRPSSLAGVTAQGAAAEPALLRRVLRADLDTILLHALEAEPERRYASAGALADDVQRHLEGHPVAAHPPSRLYRARKFVARHRGGVLVVTSLLLAVLASLVIALWQAGLARREARRADEQAARAVAVRDFMVDLFDAAKARLLPDERPTPDVLVRQARERIERDASLSPSVRADVLHTLGEVSMVDGDAAAALQSFERAADLKSRLYAPDDVERWSTDVQRANALQRLGRAKEALPIVEALLPALRATAREESLEGLEVLAVAQTATGQSAAALATAREVAAKAPLVFARGSRQELQCAAYPGNTLVVIGRHADAVAELEPVLARWRASGVALDDEFARVLNNLAVSKHTLGEVEVAMALFSEAGDLLRRINPRSPLLAGVLRSLGQARIEAGEPEAAEASLREARSVEATIYPERSLKRVNSMVALSSLYNALGRDADAEREANAALSLCEIPDGASYDKCAIARHQLGLLYLRQRKLDAAEAEIDRALAQRRRVYGDGHVNVAVEYTAQARIALARADAASALVLSANATGIFLRNHAADGRDALVAGIAHAYALLDAGRAEDALVESEALLAAWRERMRAPTAQRFELRALRALALAARGSLDDAHDAAAAALAEAPARAALDPTLYARAQALAGRR